MSTHCRIGVVNQDGSVDSIYCHFDGHLGLGTILETAFNDLDKINKLLSQGDLEHLSWDENGVIRAKPVFKLGLPTYCESVEQFNRFYNTEYMYLWYYNRWVVSLPQHPRVGPGKYITLDKAWALGIQ
jgi:hypothetical protein